MNMTLIINNILEILATFSYFFTSIIFYREKIGKDTIMGIDNVPLIQIGLSFSIILTFIYIFY